MKNRAFIILLIVGFSIIAFGVLKIAEFGRIQETNVEAKPSNIDNTAPEFTLPDIDGNEVSLSDFKGKVIILDFWATWCPPCKKEIPHFIELYDEYKDKGLEIIGVSLDAGGEKVVRAFARKNSINYTLLLADKKVPNLYGGIFSIPTTFVIDREGVIRKKYIGYRDKKVFEDDVITLLGKEQVER